MRLISSFYIRSSGPPVPGVWIARLRDPDLTGLVTLQEGDALYAKMKARSLDCPKGANHLMFVSATDESAGRVGHWDLGTVDIPNGDLRDFKKRVGAGSNRTIWRRGCAARKAASP